uniref:Uncharacterized protein n=1 Tax=Strombidium rassoulzadegani TaxID=1082188 RepID=A0A7S3CIP3_9SPIT|mmetsp:Transcript_12021/g.20293  ORF Transcript_12021/g.20293 Transcript_12021/m.20293 type:complete len:328 (+) Transcript_12021:333-1316(+)
MTREDYFRALWDFEVQCEEIRHIKRMINEQKRLKGALDDKEERISKKRAEIQSRPNPYTKEIETCDSLIAYCNKLKVQKGMIEPSQEEVAKSVQKNIISGYSKQDIDQKLKDGKILAAHSKKDDGGIQVGAGKGKKGKKQKGGNSQKAENDSSFNIDFAVINKFGLVMVSPPISPEDLDPKMKELELRKVKLAKDGEAELAEEKRNLMKHVENEVEEELKKEAREAEMELTGYDETLEEEKVQASRDEEELGGGARGGRGSVRGRGGNRRAKIRGEFEGSDDENEFEDAYSKPKRGGGQQVNQVTRGGRGGNIKNLMKYDDDEFPTL